jgi:hypothetical protein
MVLNLKDDITQNWFDGNYSHYIFMWEVKNLNVCIIEMYLLYCNRIWWNIRFEFG